MANDDLAGSGGSGKKSRPGFPVDPFRVQRAIWRTKWWLIAAGFVGVVIGFSIAKFGLTSSYESTAVLKFEGFREIAGIQSDRALGPAAAALHRQAVLRKLAEEVEFPGSLTTLRALVSFNINMMGRTMQIHAPGGTPEEAADFAKTASEVFIAYHEQSQARRIETEIARIQKRISAAQDAAESDRRRYNDFRERNGIADLSTEQESMVESAAKLRADAELAVSEVRALEAQVESLETQLAATPQTAVVGSGTSPERAAYNELSQQLATARATLSENHPQVQSLQQQVNQLRAQLKAGGGTASGVVGTNATHQAIDGQLRTARSNLRALRERQIGLKELADKAQRRIEDFSDIEGEASGLLAEVKVSENLVQGLRKTEAALEDALRNPSSGFVILDSGSVPEYPLRNKMKVIIFGAVPMVLVSLALLFAFYREFWGFRVQTAAEVAFWGSGPVVGTTQWPDDPQGLDELVAGLDDFAPDARGSILILAASPEEAPLAVDLADRMNNDWVIASGASQPPAPTAAPTAVTTPPPSGPYPITRTQPSTALATRPSVRPVEFVRAQPGTERVQLEAWDGPFEGQALRRAARLADRVLVLVHADRISAFALNRTSHRLGRETGIGYVVVGLPDELLHQADRHGEVADFWMARS
ncbi:MAG: hypothetical protein AAF500_04680 [Myxococcota bacterium]